MNNLRMTGEQLIPAIAYGDAAGLPVETRSADYIAKHYGKIDHLLPSNENPFFVGNFRAGSWSDDTQLSIAVTEGLIEADGFDIHSQAEAHIRAYHETPDMVRKDATMKRGWGGSTTTAVRRLILGVDPHETGTEGGAGNGVLMKMSPLVYWQKTHNVSDQERWQQYDALTLMTHRSTVAKLTTRVHGDVLIHLLDNGFYDKDTAYAILDSVHLHEKLLRAKHELSTIKRVLMDDINPKSILEATDGKGFYSVDTLAMAYGSFFCGQGDYTPSVYTAVNLGGDTDSIASISGVMALFASRSSIELPSDSKELDQLEFLQSVSRSLARAALPSR